MLVLTRQNYDAICRTYLPVDMGDEVGIALAECRESAIEYRRTQEGAEATHYVYFPLAGRGGVCQGGETDWTDCTSLDDLANRWASYETRWCN